MVQAVLPWLVLPRPLLRLHPPLLHPLLPPLHFSLHLLPVLRSRQDHLHHHLVSLHLLHGVLFVCILMFISKQESHRTLLYAHWVDIISNSGENDLFWSLVGHILCRQNFFHIIFVKISYSLNLGTYSLHYLHLILTSIKVLCSSEHFTFLTYKVFT